MSQISFRRNISVGIGAVNENAVQGSDIEFLDGPWLVTLFATQDTADGLITLRNGSRQTVTSKASPNLNANAVVNTQQDMIIQSVLVQNAHLILTLDNAAGAAATEFRILLVAEQVPS